MKKNEPIPHDDDPAEYDFSGGVRGKHFKAMQAGYSITIHQKDGSTVIKRRGVREGGESPPPPRNP